MIQIPTVYVKHVEYSGYPKYKRSQIYNGGHKSGLQLAWHSNGILNSRFQMAKSKVVALIYFPTSHNPVLQKVCIGIISRFFIQGDHGVTRPLCLVESHTLDAAAHSIKLSAVAL